MFCCFFLLGSKISFAFAAFVKYKQLPEKQKLNKSSFEDSELKTEVDLAKTADADHKEHLIKAVIRKNLGILRRKSVQLHVRGLTIKTVSVCLMEKSECGLLLSTLAHRGQV